MPDYTPYQQKIIRNYYNNRENLALQKLEELVADLYLASTDKKREGLWNRIAKLMVNLKVPEKVRQHILEQRKPEVLAKNVADWCKKPPE